LVSHTNERYYDLAVAYASKGHFVHEWLYKILPYKIIENPCPAILGAVATNCCANLIPSTVHVTLTGAGACGCFSGSYPLTWNAVAQFWQYAGTVCGGRVFSLQFRCTGTDVNGFSLTLTCGADSLPLTPNAGSTCNPLALSFGPYAFSDCCGLIPPATADINATLTE
jgi:hypothetical protein